MPTTCQKAMLTSLTFLTLAWFFCVPAVDIPIAFRWHLFFGIRKRNRIELTWGDLQKHWIRNRWVIELATGFWNRRFRIAEIRPKNTEQYRKTAFQYSLLTRNPQLWYHTKRRI